jgi:hypothetical protein
MNVRKIIALSGCATVGKDLFCSIARNELSKRGIAAQRFALADSLKQECQDFILNKCGIDVYTTDPEEKTKIRPLLVWFGNFKRNQSNGTFWTNLLQQTIEANQFDVGIITDVRYDEYSHDEIYWAKSTMNASIVHLKRFSRAPGGIKQYIQPANIYEEINDPKIEAKADFHVEWEHVLSTIPNANLLEVPYLINIVNTTLDKIL